MKILHVLTQLPEKTGSGVYFSNLIENLERLGYENAAIYGTEEKFNIKKIADYDYPVFYNTKGLNFHIAGMSDIMPYESTVYSQMSDDMIEDLLDSFEKKLLKAKIEFKPDIIISHHLFFITDLVRRVFKDKQVIGISHGTDIRQSLKHERFLERLKNIKDLDKVLTVTDGYDDQIKEYLKVSPKKITLVGGAYNKKIFYPKVGEENKKTKIIYAGKIAESKGVLALSEMAKLLDQENFSYEMHIVGNSSDYMEQKIIEISNNSPNIKLYNAQDQMKMADHLRCADIFILPSYFEALGLIAIEALACNKKVVVSEIEGLRKLLDQRIIESGVIEFVKLPRLYDVDKPVKEDVKDYANRLKEAVKLQASRNNDEIFTKEIKGLIEIYNWKNLARRILKIIEE
ncbi:MAG: glycosyltransferase family 4 protein [Tissierellia bacterium]|nr:glycosyltransferase family 4 protein [Tissierellia bacterium]